MASEFRFRHTNSLVGLFILAATLITFVAILGQVHIHGWLFGETLYVKLPEEGPYGLRKGSPVQVAMSTAGYVQELDVEGATATLRIDPDLFSKYVRDDSPVFIRYEYILAGDSYIDIERGGDDGKLIDPHGDRTLKNTAQWMTIEPLHSILAGKTDAEDRTGTKSLIAELTRALRRFRVTARGLDTEALNETVGNLNVLLKDLQGTEPSGDTKARGLAEAVVSLQTTSEEIGALVRKVNEWGEGEALRLLVGGESLDLANETVRGVSGNLERLSAFYDQYARDLGEMVAAVRDMTVDASEQKGETGEMIKEVRQLLRQVSRDAAEIEETLNALQKTWLIRRHMEGVEESSGDMEIPIADVVTLEPRE